MSQHSDRGDGRGKGEKAGERTTKVSLKDAKMWHTPKMSSPSRTLGPRVVFSPSAPFLGGCGGEQTRNRGFREHTGKISQRAAPRRRCFPGEGGGFRAPSTSDQARRYALESSVPVPIRRWKRTMLQARSDAPMPPSRCCNWKSK